MKSNVFERKSTAQTVIDRQRNRYFGIIVPLVQGSLWMIIPKGMITMCDASGARPGFIRKVTRK